MWDAVYDVLIRNDITVVTFKWVKYMSVTGIYRMGPGFFANITTKGVWPSNKVA